MYFTDAELILFLAIYCALKHEIKMASYMSCQTSQSVMYMTNFFLIVYVKNVDSRKKYGISMFSKDNLMTV